MWDHTAKKKKGKPLQQMDCRRVEWGIKGRVRVSRRTNILDKHEEINKFEDKS